MADRASVDVSVLGHYARGKNNPSLPSLVRLMNVYGYDRRSSPGSRRDRPAPPCPAPRQRRPLDALHLDGRPR
ncbi:helix-turn-helix domain-containing protein [Actinoplanes lutulentus]|uniref:helix-turn-helix domain-containing protein n=1 Tax=Actinoplanes lutulentus TaxID=1287878 RepID=UPI0035D4D557